MQFLADESCDFSVVRALRDEGHEVLAVSDAARGAKDADVVRLAREGGRVLLTDAVRSLGDRLARSFVVVEPGRVRVSATPPHDPQS